METKHFSLQTGENNRFIRIVQSVFGIACIVIACYWLIYNYNSVRSDSTLWITVLFLAGFGAYLIWSAMGYGYRFVEFNNGSIRLKKNSFLPLIEMNAPEIEKIDVYPLKVTIRLKSKKLILARFGVTDIEKAELIKDEFLRFSEANRIENEIMNEM